MKEIEMKCWVTPENTARIEKFLETETTFLGKKSKKDRNFKRAGGENIIAFRLRAEISEDATGKNTGKKFWVTQKNKKYLENGLECNDELEFEVSDGDAFEAFVVSQGYEMFYTKAKNVAQYAQEISGFSVLLEYAEIPQLGKFLEIEIVSEKDDDQTIKNAEKSILSIFKTLHLQSDIEKKPYIVLLNEGQVG